MKLQLPSSRRCAGNTLLLTLVIAAVVGFILVAYLNLVRAQHMATMRSQAWNVAVPVIEAGIEDALAHLNAHAGSSLACDGWHSAGSYYWLYRHVGDHFYIVTISNYFVGITTNAPVIESRGYVSMPTLVASASSGPLLASTTMAMTYKNYLGRGVRVRTRQDALFAKGLVARDTIDMNGNNIEADSFDSTDANYSTSGQYDSTKHKDKGDVATNSSLTNSLNVGNADIFGHVATGPNGSVAIGPQGSVGDMSWHAANRRGIKPGFYNDDMNVNFPDVETPFNGGFSLNGGYVTNADGSTTYYDQILEDGNYQTVNLSGTTYVRGQAKLLVTGGISMSGHDEIVIPEGKTLKLYMAGTSASLGGNGVMNSDGYATNFFYYGLPENTSLSLSGNGAFVGTVYAPNAALTLNGGGHNKTDFVGAAITKTARLNGHFSFHYDEALKTYGPVRSYVITDWDEMTPDEVGATVISIPVFN